MGGRRVAGVLLGVALRCVPERAAVALARRVPRIAPFLPVGIEGVFDGYLGEFRTLIDTTYPIERQMLAGAYDRATLRVIERHVRPGDVCLDVGANVGAIMFALARAAGRSGKVYAVEPGPPMFDRLLRNLDLNPGWGRVVQPERLGLSDRPGRLYWQEDPTNRGNAGLLNDAGTAVEVTTLDDFVSKRALGRLDFVKVDVEGMEYEVIRGGLRALADLRPIVYYETLEPFRAFRGFDIFGEIRAMLEPLGYEFFKVDPLGRLHGPESAVVGENTLAVPKAGGG